MLYDTDSNRSKFEVSLFNKDVRALVKENRSHTFYEDRWADTQVHDISAEDEREARRLMAERFSPEEGFVIERVARCG
ncbi:MAG: hypothetical protein H6907_22220 [Hyphomicrobiales bacterium]|nr:hypothetical protein [Hyphomicrobiales bacterium]